MRKSGKVTICSVEGCGRHVRSRGLCQTHGKHLKRQGRIMPIRPFRRRRSETVRFGGLSLTARTADILAREAEVRCIARNALMTDIIETWARRRCRATRPPSFPSSSVPSGHR